MRCKPLIFPPWHARSYESPKFGGLASSTFHPPYRGRCSTPPWVSTKLRRETIYRCSIAMGFSIIVNVAYRSASEPDLVECARMSFTSGRRCGCCAVERLNRPNSLLYSSDFPLKAAISCMKCRGEWRVKARLSSAVNPHETLSISFNSSTSPLPGNRGPGRKPSDSSVPTPRSKPWNTRNMKHLSWTPSSVCHNVLSHFRDPVIPYTGTQKGLDCLIRRLGCLSRTTYPWTISSSRTESNQQFCACSTLIDA